MKRFSFSMFIGLLMAAPQALATDIVHDADYYVLEAQHKDQWAQDDKTVDQKLEDVS